MRFVNLTPHPIVVRLSDGTERKFEPSGTVARVSSTDEVVGEVDGIPVVQTTFGDIVGLPDARDDTVCIVSSLVLGRAIRLGRNDVVAPDTGATAIRDENGRIVAVTRFRTE